MSFDRLAPFYRSMEGVLAGGLLQRARTHFLAATADSQRALLLGEGPGRFLAALLRSHPGVQVTCVEQSPRMIEAARRQFTPAQLARVAFIAADALNWEPERAGFDLVVTHFFLDCFPPAELELVVSKAVAAARPGARWLLTDFCEAESGWQRWRSRVVLALMYRFFRLVTNLPARRLTAPDSFLQARGFRLKGRQLSNFGLVHSDLWEHETAGG